MAFQITMQRMQLPAWRTHIFRQAGIVEGEKLFAKAFSVARLDFGFRSGSEEELDSLVTEASDHSCSV